MIELNENYRVLFPEGQQSRFIFTIKKSSNCNWTDMAKSLGISLQRLSTYRGEECTLPIKYCKNLCDISDGIFNFDDILKNIKILPNYWASFDAGKKGGNRVKEKYGLEYFKRIGSIGASKGGNVIKSLYGIDHFWKMSKLGREKTKKSLENARSSGKYYEWALKSATNKLKKTSPNDFERKIILINKKIKLTPKFQFQISLGSNIRFFDFAYFKNKKLFILEEVSGHRWVNYGKIIDIIIRDKNLDVPLVATFKHKPNYNCLLMLLENKIPFFIESEKWTFEYRNKILISENNNYYFTHYLKKLREWLSKEIAKNNKRLFGGEKSQLKISNDFEKILHQFLLRKNLKTKGKIILKTKFNTFLVPDDYIEDKGVCFLITNSSSRAAINQRIFPEHAGYAYAIKNLVDPKLKCISVLFGLKRKDINWRKSIYSRYFKKIVNYVVTEEELDKIPNILEGGI